MTVFRPIDGVRAAAVLFLLAATVAADTPARSSTDAAAEASSEATTTTSIEITGWLGLGPWVTTLPLGDDVEVSSLLGGSSPVVASPVGDVWPAAGDTVSEPSGGEIAWRSSDGTLVLEDAELPHQAYLVAYLDAQRFAKPELVVRSRHPLRILLDGDEVGKQAKSSAPPAETPRRARNRRASRSTDTGLRTTATLELEPGKHLLLIQTLYDPDAGGDWRVDATLGDVEVVGEAASVAVDLEPRHGLSLDDLLETPAIGSLALSPDGRHLAVALAQPSVPSSQRDRWTEIVDVASGEIVHSLRGQSGVVWSPDGRWFSYDTPGFDEGTRDLWKVPVGGEGRPIGGPAEAIVRGVKDLVGHRWSPDGRSLFLEVQSPYEGDDRGAKRYRDLADRWSDRRDARSVFRISAQGGLAQRLTSDDSNQALLDIRPDGAAVLLARIDQTVTERPFSSTELLELDLSTLTARTVATLGWFGTASYSPDGRRLLITGGPSIFERAGSRLDPEVVPNDYDTQAYVLDLETGEVDALTVDYDPSVLEAHWSKHDEKIYLRIQDGARSALAAYDPRDETWTRFDSGTEVVMQASLAEAAGTTAFVGASPTEPHAVYVLTTETPAETPAEARRLLQPGDARYARAEIGEVRDWSFTSSGGDTIQGRYYLPPGFDRSKRHPLIVDYYGGTVPVSRGFGGRYPKAYWAARGYVVLVVQPSGATGYGQEFSARHVDAWGRRTADEIIEGTEAFVAEHDFVDRERIGCIGASYGGFMTMYLLTRTDLFAAAVSHAGISNLASYWGAGWWGYLYSSVASADSYPWNDRELYVDQSPLFSADKIETPLLLLHGDADTNVPPVESQQMFTALRLLGREVELIEIEGEDHWILDFPKRRLWSQTIVAWFDKQLKNEPEWWESLWGTDDEPRG